MDSKTSSLREVDEKSRASTGVIDVSASTTGTADGNEQAKKSRVILKWNSNPSAPLILLFGWAGCRDRYLAKYSDIYEAKGCSVLRFTVPVTKIKCYFHYRRFAIDVYEKAFGISEPHFPVYFHVFSMNGCALFSSLWDVLDDRPYGAAIKRAVDGVIFDSCPADVRPWQAAEAVTFATMPAGQYGIVQRTAYRYMLVGMFSVHRALIRVRSVFERNVYEQHFAYYHMLKITDLPKRQLYLYSKVDTICSVESIEFFRALQAQRTEDGIELVGKCWKDSSHVEHIRKYGAEYVAHCLQFIGCEDGNDGGKRRQNDGDQMMVELNVRNGTAANVDAA